MFFCITLVIIISLICTVTESARVYASAVCAKSCGYRALESEFAGYVKQIYDDYGILTKWENYNLEEAIERRMISEQGESGGFTSDLLVYQIDNVSEIKKKYVTDDGASEFVEQVLMYEKYDAVADGIEALINYCSEYEGGEAPDADELYDDYDDAMDKNSKNKKKEEMSLINDYDSLISNLDKYDFSHMYADAKDIYFDYYSDGKVPNGKKLKKIKKKLKKITKKVAKADKVIEKLLEMQETYLSTKSEIEEKYGTTQAHDVVESNSEYIKQMKNEVDKLLEIDVDEIVTEDGYDKDCLDYYLNPILDELGIIKKVFLKLEYLDCSEEDKENLDIFEGLMDTINAGVLALVTPDDMKISNYSIERTDLPSEEIESDDGELDNLFNKGLFIYYICDHFGNALKCDNANALQYGMEYILVGGDSDKDNLTMVCEELFGVRMVLNNLYFVTDTEKMAICDEIAAGASLALGMPFLEPLIKLLVMEAWIFLESVSDVKVLLSGGCVNFMKTAAEWRTSITGKGKADDGVIDKLDDKGVIQQNYELYLMVMMMVLRNEDMIYRALDLIQLNTNKKYNPNIRINRCLVEAELEISYLVKGVLPGIGIQQLESAPNKYLYTSDVEYGYTM